MRNLKYVKLFRKRFFLTGKAYFVKNIISAALVMLLIMITTNDGAFETYEQTKSLLFSTMIGSFITGFFNSIIIYNSEQNYIYDELKYKDLSVGVYISGSIINQLSLCIVQAVLVTVLFSCFLEYPSEGIVFNANFDYLITFFLTIFSADCLGLLLGFLNSSMKSCMAIVPATIIIQMLLSGCLFDLDVDIFQKVSKLTTAYYSFSCFGSISDLNSNDLPLSLQLVYSNIKKIPNDLFDHSVSYVTRCWLHLGILSAIMLMMSYLLLSIKIHKKQ